MRTPICNELGIEFDKTGALSYKEEKFTKLLENNFDDVAEVAALYVE